MSFKKTLDAYDPYGVYRVNAFQCCMMITALFIMNAAFHFPQFNNALFLPVFGTLALCATQGYAKRLEAMCIYSVATIAYAIALSFVHDSRFLTVIMVGIAISSFFILARTYKPQLLAMIPMIHIAAYTSLAIPSNGGEQLLRWSLNLALMAAFTIALLALFPHIYFFRVWLRVFYLTIIEMEEKLHLYKKPELIEGQILFRHFKQIPMYTATLCYKQHGFSARRISIALANMYITMTALLNDTVSLETPELQELSLIFQRFARAINDNQPLQDLDWGPSENLCFLQFRRELCAIVSVWNQLCLKL